MSEKDVKWIEGKYGTKDMRGKDRFWRLLNLLGEFDGQSSREGLKLS